MPELTLAIVHHNLICDPRQSFRSDKQADFLMNIQIGARKFLSIESGDFENIRAYYVRFGSWFTARRANVIAKIHDYTRPDKEDIESQS